jgi:hypothetical protein
MIDLNVLIMSDAETLQSLLSSLKHSTEVEFDDPQPVSANTGALNAPMSAEELKLYAEFTILIFKGAVSLVNLIIAVRKLRDTGKKVSLSDPVTGKELDEEQILKENKK